jgi:quercetin dioxygenase-like cupin family protein
MIPSLFEIWNIGIMEKETLKSVLHDQTNNSADRFRSVAFDLSALIEMMKHSNAWQKGELNTLILLKNPNEKIILTAIHEGTEIKSFQADDSITIQVLEGELSYRTHNEYVILAAGQFITVHDKIKYMLTASEDTVFLLTLLDKNLRIA